MKKRVSLILCIVLIFSILPLAEAGPLSWEDGMDTEGFLASLNDWILGTDWGILSGSIDPEGRMLKFILSSQSLDALTLQDEKDIREAMLDMLSLYLSSREAAGMFSILYQAGDAALMEAEQEPDGERAAVIAPQGQTEAAKTNLVFIHHSVGENWLRQGLAQMLNDHGYHVADITYGWREYGDYTDTRDWPGWFKDGVMALVYRELGTMSAENSLEPANGENTVILFKSCFPNSDIGSSMDDEKAVYNSLLPYFQSRPDKLFILATPPPMIRIPSPGLTRQLCRWLTDRQEGWLANLETGNVFVFDLYNVLTHPDAHHQMVDGQEVHTAVPHADTLYYDSDGDDHPNEQGSQKAAEEFILLLDHWVAQYNTGSSL